MVITMRMDAYQDRRDVREKVTTLQGEHHDVRHAGKCEACNEEASVVNSCCPTAFTTDALQLFVTPFHSPVPPSFGFLLSAEGGAGGTAPCPFLTFTRKGFQGLHSNCKLELWHGL